LLEKGMVKEVNFSIAGRGVVKKVMYLVYIVHIQGVS
jgi:hypothetical protein